MIFAGTAALALPALARAAPGPTLRVGVQEAGTALWEIETIERLDLPGQLDFAIDLRRLADSRAGQIALQTGAVDVILSDFIFVSAQRHSGWDLTLVPHSLAVGGVVALRRMPSLTSSDLAAHQLAVAGGPLDKNWVLLQAAYHRRTLRKLSDDADIRFGAPPLVYELLINGRIPFGLNYWQWNARAEAEGAAEVLTVDAILREMGVDSPPPLLGWTFSAATGVSKSAALTAFLQASFAAKAALLHDDSLWLALSPTMGVPPEAVLFRKLRDRYRQGIVSHYRSDDVAGAVQLLDILAEYGGDDVVGNNAGGLAPGTFWPDFSA